MRDALAIAALILAIAGCATGEMKETSAPPEAPAPKIDLLAVQHDLEMDSTSDQVGYREKRFDACRMIADLPGLKDCAHAFFVQIGIQLSCRASEEGESVVVDRVDLTPVGFRDLHWQLGDLSGTARTDANGFGSILMITSRSMKMQGLRVSTGKDYLIIRAGQATQIVTPASWCE